MIFFRVTLLAILIFSSEFTFFKCSSSGKTEVNKNKSANEYFPLGDNIVWKYINEAPRDETIIIDVKCKKLKDGGKFQFSNYPFFGNDEKNISVSEDKSGSITVLDAQGKQLLLIPETSKLKNDYTWLYNDFLYGYLKTTPVKVTTEAGTYECIYVTFTEGFTFSIEMWLAKDVGIVKWGANRSNPPSLRYQYYVLKEYNE